MRAWKYDPESLDADTDREWQELLETDIDDGKTGIEWLRSLTEEEREWREDGGTVEM